MAVLLAPVGSALAAVAGRDPTTRPATTSAAAVGPSRAGARPGGLRPSRARAEAGHDGTPPRRSRSRSENGSPPGSRGRSRPGSGPARPDHHPRPPDLAPAGHVHRRRPGLAGLSRRQRRSADSSWTAPPLLSRVLVAEARLAEEIDRARAGAVQAETSLRQATAAQASLVSEARALRGHLEQARTRPGPAGRPPG